MKQTIHIPKNTTANTEYAKQYEQYDNKQQKRIPNKRDLETVDKTATTKYAQMIRNTA
jgi:hypothetical protein